MSGAAEWDARFRAGDHAEAAPDPFLLSSKDCLNVLPAGAAALDLACGAGRHAVWLAEQGFQVTAADFSAEALARTAALAGARGVRIEGRQLDLESPAVDLGGEAFALICGLFFLHRPLFPILRAALQPGGLIIYKTYTVDQARYPGRPRHRVHMLEHNELLRLLEGFRVLRYEEQWDGRGTAAIVAQKPAQGGPTASAGLAK